MLKSYCRACVVAFGDPYTTTFVNNYFNFFSGFELYKIHCTLNDSRFAYKRRFMTTRVLLLLCGRRR